MTSKRQNKAAGGVGGGSSAAAGNSSKQTGSFPKAIYTTVAGILKSIEKVQVSRARQLVLRGLDASVSQLSLNWVGQIIHQQKQDHFLPPISTQESQKGGQEKKQFQQQQQPQSQEQKQSTSAPNSAGGGSQTLDQIQAHGGGGTALGNNIDPDELPQVFPPFLPPFTKEQEAKDPFTLVLDLDQTLVHYFEIEGQGHFLVRPGVQNFLQEMSEIYELVIFTAAMQDYADCVLNQMDSKKLIKYRLYRQHALPYGNIFVKDLSRLGRDLSRLIIVDNVAENFQLQPDNGIFIRSWFDDPSDTALQELAPLLKQVVKKNLDVRVALKKFRDQMLDQISRGITNPKLTLDDSIDKSNI